MSTFVESSVVVELASLSALLVLCGLRRVIRTIPPWGQRLACALVPAAVTSLVVQILSWNELAVVGLSRVTPIQGMVIAGLFRALMQHYFELRTSAFSPAL